MNLDHLMEVWRSQDTAPLHGVNDTLLRLALRQDEAKLAAKTRLARRIAYAMCVFFIAVMALLLLIMIHDKVTPWEYAVPIVGAAAGVIWAGVMYASHRAQARREQGFGESLRDQLRRHIAQIDYYATRAGRLSFVLANNLPATVWSAALFYGTLRINEKSFSDNWGVFAGTMLWCAMAMVGSVWWQRRVAQRRLLPHKRRLEALLAELDN
jgi:ABC-type transport system involved in cytochrome c biogenesis permease subunit